MFSKPDTYVEGDETISEEQLDADLAEALADMKALRAGKIKFRETIVERETQRERDAVAALVADLLTYANAHTLNEEDVRTVEALSSRVRQLVP